MRMHSHIGCICLTFLHCVFSNVSSEHLPGRMHNHIVCIYLAFRHCVFSNVHLNGSFEMKHNCTGCNCSTFWHFQSFSWGFVCSSCDFQEFLPVPFSALNCASPNGHFLILRQIWGFRIFRISVEKGKWMSWLLNIKSKFAINGLKVESCGIQG